MFKTVLIFVSIGFLFSPSQSISQPLQIDDRFGMQLQFPEGWSLLSQDLHSSMLQRQLFASANEETGVFVENVFMLSELNKREWANGIAGHPLSYADTVMAVEREDWLFDPPDFKSNVFSEYPNGISVFFAEASNWIGYVVFISRDGAFTKLNVTASKDDIEPDLAGLQAILSTLTFAPEAPVIAEDPFTMAEKAHTVERDYEQALFLYKQVPENHPRYVDALRMIGYGILGKQFEDWAAALPYVEKAYRVSPDDPKVLEDIGRVYLKTDRVEQGIDFLEKAGTRVAREALSGQGTTN